jgi:hypothetical protein
MVSSRLERRLIAGLAGFVTQIERQRVMVLADASRVSILRRSMTLGIYDLLLAVVVSAQATVVAYLYAPRWKAFAFMIPLPFTFATLALGQRVDATAVLGMALVALFAHAVRILYRRWQVPIVTAIALSAVGYSIIGWALAGVIPRDDRTFFVAMVVVVVVAAALLWLQPHRDEPGHRTSLPIWAKLPIILGVILFLVIVKQELRGFMAMFPMVSIVATYEARHSLWTLCRQVPIMMLGMAGLMTISRWLEPKVGLAPSLAVGWLAFLAVALPLSRSLWNNDGEGAVRSTDP